MRWGPVGIAAPCPYLDFWVAEGCSNLFAVADVDLLALGAKVDSVTIAVQRGRRTAAADDR